MNVQVGQALDVTLNNWDAMSGSEGDEAEEAANAFEASFYIFIDTLSDWVLELEQPPQTLEEFLELPMIQSIVERLPAPLYLNFETEAELIIENKTRIEEDKYD
ncbi:hypothetical protein [Paenibacillus abyssi]|uniref:Uncharacterized protein n=1 Tax=Paenibacillus abyssi TaxID=1340531 RepID=A0A917FYP5_9BACL|nr:hypothetical protein [Paenibacillus abyssi]GGG14422.1 hypothetical protein GCM10010916_34170 [Paenibacillus abyssi]